MLDRLTIERMAAKAGENPIVIALSGGGDSVALLHLLVDELGAARLRAAIVDHALREGSAEDARRAASFAEKLGVLSTILTVDWRGAPFKRSQQAARSARYVVLCEHARALGGDVIAAAHTADDQAETVMMRAAAGSTWRGLAGMAPLAPAPVWPEGRGLALARPLLGVRRTALREELRRRNAEWIEDPANANDAFERVRVRARLSELEHQGFEPTRLAAVAERVRVRADALDRQAADLIARAARFTNDRIVIDLAQWKCADEVRQRALSVLVAAVAGTPREPGAGPIKRLHTMMVGRGFPGATLGGASLMSYGARVIMSRDTGALEGRADGAKPAPPLLLRVGREVVWDGRLAVTASAPDASILRDGRIVGSDGTLRTATTRWLVTDHAAHLLAVDAGVLIAAEPCDN